MSLLCDADNRYALNEFVVTSLENPEHAVAAPSLAIEKPFPIRLIVVLCAATALGPMAMQIVMPALPIIQAHHGVTSGVAQLIFSVSAFAIAAATLVYGPVSDYFGRRPAILGGLVTYVAGSLICVVAPTIEWLIAGRVIQAAGGCAGIVLSRAIVRDLFERERAAQMIAYITMGMVVAPMLSPVIGGFLIDATHWRSIFVFGGLLGLVILYLVVKDLTETAPSIGEATSLGSMVSAFAILLRSRPYVAYSLQGAFSMSVFFAFLAGAPYLLISTYGYSPSAYGLYFMVVSGLFILGNFTAARTTRLVGSDRLIVLGSLGTSISCSVALLLSLMGYWSPLALFLPMGVTAYCQGVSMPNGQAAVVSVYPNMAGSASGLAGFLQMGLAAIVAQIVGMFQNDTPYPTVLGMTICAIAAFWAILVALRSRT